MNPLLSVKRLIPFLLLVLGLTATAVGQTSASLSGIVRDQQNKAIAGAKVTALETSKNFQLDTTTSEEGTFAFPVLQPGTYSIRVEAPGFKQLTKTGIILNAADKQSAGTLTLEVGEVTSTIEVSAEVAQLQIKTESGEQSEVITGRQVRELAINGRNYLDLVKLIPGVQSTFNGQVAGPGGLGSFSINGTRQNTHNLTIDGSTNVDTGSNGTQHVALNLDTIAEFKVLTSNYQAEYGRSSGGDIKIVTRSGTNEFHGTGYLFHRHEGLNANTFTNNYNVVNVGGQRTHQPIARSLYRYNYFGYNIGGPVKLPGGALKDKLFFFWAQDWSRQLVPTNPRLVRMPTAAEITGDFSATRDSNGNPITIRDPLTGQPFPGNKIPTNRFNANGLAILKLFNKHENAPTGLPLFNHSSQLSSGYPRRQETLRVDFNATDNTRISFRGTQDSDQQILPYGVGWTSGQNFPLTPTIFKQGPAYNASLNVTTTLSPTMTNEFIFGPSQNNLSLDPQDANAATYSGIGLNFKTPFPYPPEQFINITFGGVPGTFGAINAYSQFPYRNSNTTFDIIDNISKVWGPHTMKAGFYFHRSRKDQAAGNSMAINFSHNTNDPNNSGHPFANALLGNFNTFSQPTRGIYQGQYRSSNAEWFLQDTWKVNRRLTLDYGLRFSWIQPQYDQRLQPSFFVPERFDPSKAVRLYRRNTAGQAIDPANPAVTLPSFLVGRIVPGSGDPFNGMAETAKGYLRGGVENPGVQFGPAFGFAYDVFGNAKTVVRGGYRIAYDRVSGNDLIFPAVAMPPFFVNPVFNFGNLDTVGQSTGQIALAPSRVDGVDPTGDIPNVHSFSLQVQQEVGFETVVSVAYVGTLSRHLSQLYNLNYIPYGATFLRENQDPSRFPGGIIPESDSSIAQVYKDAGLKFDGSKALTAEFLRRYPGYNDIGYMRNDGNSNYHSLQATVQRRFSRGLTFGAAYTWSKALGTANGQRDFVNPENPKLYDYRRLSFDREHMLAINYVWNLPKFSQKFGLGDNWLARGIFDNWELSGISQFQTGNPTEVGISITGVNLNQRITGSWTEGPRILLTGDPTGGGDRTDRINLGAFRLPDVGSRGLGPRSYLDRPGIQVTDLSVFKNFPLGGEGTRYLQLRVEMFNVFNHPQFDNYNSGFQFDIASNFSNYKDRQQASPSSIFNVRGGARTPDPITDRLGRAVGDLTSQPGFVSSSRVIQLAMKLYF